MYSKKELQNLQIDELLKELKTTEHEYIKCKIEVKTSARKDSHTLKKLKKYIAQLKTIIHELRHEEVKVAA